MDHDPRFPDGERVAQLGTVPSVARPTSRVTASEPYCVPMVAGYASTPLARKLGIIPGVRALVRGAPPSLGPMFAELVLVTRVTAGMAPLGYIHLFSADAGETAPLVTKLAPLLDDRGLFWISWPKKASKVPTTLDEHAVRAFGLEAGLVDVKVCAVDEVWSGLKFVRRVADRARR